MFRSVETYPVEAKVRNQTIATAVTGLVLSVLGYWIPVVPDPVKVIIGLGILTAVNFITGWQTRHTPRPVENPPEAKPLGFDGGAEFGSEGRP